MLPTGWEKRLVDLNVSSLLQKDLAWADFVFVSGMVVQRDAARAVIARCKKAGKKVVAGGPLFTIEHEQFPEVDHFVLNEAELTLPPFLADLAYGRPQRIYTTSEYPISPKPQLPLWQIANLKNYDSISIQFSRGCPFSCDFCNVTAMLGHRPAPQSRSADRRRAGQPVCPGLAQEHLLRGRQLYRQQEGAKNRSAASADRMAQRQDRHGLQHRSIDQPGGR